MTSRKNQPPIRLLIADANAMVCELLTGAFKRRRAFEIAGCAVNLQEVLAIASDSSIDIALVGVHLQDGPGTGLRALQQLRVLQPMARSVVLLGRSEESLIVESFRAGAKGVFSRSQHDFEVLCKCVARVHDGQIWANSAELEQLIEALRRSSPAVLTNSQGLRLLSAKESRIVRLVSEGMTNREIATELGLSGHTVKNYLFKIFDKLGISNRVELALYATNQKGHIELDAEEVLQNAGKKAS